MIASFSKIPLVTGYGGSIDGLGKVNKFAFLPTMRKDFDGLRMQREHASCPSESLVGAAKVDMADLILSQRRCAHHARLNGDVKIC